MVNKIKTCVFISGRGSNFLSILKYSRDYNFPIKIELVISNNIKAKGLIYANKYGIPFKFFSGKIRFQQIIHLGKKGPGLHTMISLFSELGRKFVAPRLPLVQRCRVS